MRAADAGLLRICAVLKYPWYWASIYLKKHSPADFPGRRLSISTGALPHYLHSTTHHPLLLVYHWLRGALQRLVPVGAAVSHALGALTAVVGIGDGGDVSEPLATGGALESGFVAGGARDWRRTVYDCFSTLDLTHSVSAQLGGATCARGVGSNAVIFGACRLLGLFLGDATCARGVGSNTVIFGTCRLLGLFFGPTRCRRSSAALPALGLWDLTPNPSAHVGCSGSSESTSRVAGLCGSERIRSSALLHRSRSERLLDASERGRMFHRRHISHALASPGPIARSLLPESPVSFRSTADSPIHEISNEIMAPMTMFQPHFKSGVRLWACWCTVIEVDSNRLQIRSPHWTRVNVFKSESQHRRLTSLASTGFKSLTLEPAAAASLKSYRAKSSPTQAFRPPFTSTIQFDLNQTPDDVVNPDSSSEPRIRIPRSVSPAPRTQPGLMLAPFQIAQIGRRGDTPNSICAGRRDQAAHRARKARATSPTPALRTSASSLVPRLERRFELGVGCEGGVRGRARASSVPPTPPPAPLPSVRLSLVPRLERRFELGVGCEGGVRAMLGIRLPPPPSLRPVATALVPRPSSRAPIRAWSRLARQRASTNERRATESPTPALATSQACPSSLVPRPSPRFESSPAAAHRIAAEAGNRDEARSEATGVRAPNAQRPAHPCPPYVPQRTSGLPRPDSRSESAGNAACEHEHERAASRPPLPALRTPLRRPCPPYVAPR
ncbi:hypothetical protein B0H15DRAFT_955829 [Mycena belliarum]|uniref:Uncharacterized protein n=1 Tax=Mycena belliarum TaxID=1033014 RepID=A0AAD6XI31_9AGAR|nr:hypothetical protein B0H15DRAFT_955829 [Mycena belliae]